jgi:nucleoside-triphosphatase THEP1
MSKTSVEKKCENEIRAVLEKHNCTLVYEEIKRNGQVIAFEIKAIKNGNN